MAYGDIKRQRIGLPFASVGAPSNSNFTLNQTTDAVEFIFMAAESVTVTRLGFRNGVLNGTATTWKISLQGVDGSNGRADGTIKGGGSPASGTFTNSGLTANNWNWVTLDNSFAISRGDYLAIVVAYSSGTTPSAGVNTIEVTTNAAVGNQPELPFATQVDNGTATKQGASLPVFAYGSATKAYGYPYRTQWFPNLSSSTNPNEQALRIFVPTSAASTFVVAGMRFFSTIPAAATNTMTVRLYDGTTVLQDVTVDGEIGISGTRWWEVYFDEATLSTLNAGQEYRLALAPQTTGVWVPQGITMDAAADVAAYAGGTDFYLSSRNGGAWTDDTTTRPFFEAIVDDWQAPSGGGTVPIGFASNVLTRR